MDCKIIGNNYDYSKNMFPLNPVNFVRNPQSVVKPAKLFDILAIIWTEFLKKKIW